MALEGNLTRAIALAQTGDTRTAASLLAAWVRAQPASELGWYWLGQCLDDPQQRRHCFEQVLRINPQHEAALRTLIKLESELHPLPHLYPDDTPLPPPVAPAPDAPPLAAEQLPGRPLVARLLGPGLAVVLILAVLVFAWLALLN